MSQASQKRTWSHFFPCAALSELLGRSEFILRDLQLARDRRQLFSSTQGGGGSFDLKVDSEACLETAGNPGSHFAWDDPNFLVFMDSVSGPPAPSGDLRFVVETLTGKQQVVVVQCKKVGAGTKAGRDRTASIQDIEHHLTQLRACFDRSASHPTQVFTIVSEHQCYYILFRHRFKDPLHTTMQQLALRWNARANSVPVELVYVWVTTARASPKLLNYACQQHDLIVVHHDMIMRMCPLLAIAPELYSVKPLAPVESGLQQVKASQSSKQIYCALPRTQARAYRHSVPCMQVNKRHIMHKTTSLACNAGCTLQRFA